MPPALKIDLRFKLANVNVMIIDNDERSASLIHQLLLSFGFRKIKIVHDGTDAVKYLRAGRTDLIITEWATGSINGLSLIKAIRTAKNDKFIDESTPVIMLTARSEMEYVQQARDAGVTEFLAKPFSARTLSNRLIEVVTNPREFIETPTFSGPSRRRKDGPPPGVAERRLPRAERQRVDGLKSVTASRPNTTLLEMLEGTDVLDILTEDVINEAQTELMKAEGDFINWVRDDIAQLENAYTRMQKGNGPDARAQMIRAAYTIKAQSGMFGYEMGTIVADMLVNYVNEHMKTTEQTLIVIRKHIDTIGVIIAHRVKDAESHVGLALIDSLNKLIAKFA